MPIQHVGRPIKRLEDPKLVQGRDAYVNDVRLEGAHRATNDAVAAGQVLQAILREGGLSYREVVQRQREHANALDRARFGGR